VGARNLNDPFIRRCQLVTPAGSERIIDKALALECDSLVIDLEDAIAPSAKAQAREVMRRTLAHTDTQHRPRRELAVRINGLESPWCLEDLLALEGLPIDSVVVPKIHRPEDLYVFDQLLCQLELRGGRQGLTLQPLIESAAGLENAAAIARASARCRTLIFGVGDFIADTGMAFDAGLLLPARARIVTAAAASGVQAIDHVHPAVADLEGLRHAARGGRALGFVGKWAIHPQQVATIQAAFSPSAEEVARARRIVDAYEEALSRGQGAIAVDGQLVDEAVLKAARRHLALTNS
jgi:citrate lyase subunit beta / citryl-CoA lyase